MACSTLKRPCGPFPSSVTLQQISGVVFIEDVNGITMQWTENDTIGDTVITVVDLVSGDRIDYIVVGFLAPSTSVFIPLAYTGIFGISYWKEDGAERSIISSAEYPFLQGNTSEQVLHNGIEVSQLTELVVHTREQIYLVQDNTVEDYLLTEDSAFTISG